MKRFLIFGILILCCILSGCASTSAIKVVNKDTSLAKNENNGRAFFKVDCGAVRSALLYFDMRPEAASSQKKITRVALREKGSFNGNLKFDPTYFLLDMPSGRWEIVNIDDPTEQMAYMYGLAGALVASMLERRFQEVNLKFNVKPELTNYLGTFKFILDKNVMKLAEVIDEEKEAQEVLSQNYPKIHEPLEKQLASHADFKGVEKKEIVQNETEDQREEVSKRWSEPPQTAAVLEQKTSAGGTQEGISTLNEYYQYVRKTVAGAVVRPEDSAKGTINVAFTVRSNGAVENIKFLEGSSEDAFLRIAVSNAINNSAPFPPFPDDMKSEGSKTFTIAIEF